MQAHAAQDHLLDLALELDHDQFEQLCKMLIERAEQTRDLELTPFRGDAGIDVHAVIDRDLFHARLGVQAKQYSPGNTVGARTIRSFKGALSDQNYHIGTVITTSSYTSGALDSAEKDFIRLIDGQMLAEIMVDGQVGVVEVHGGSYEEDQDFWLAFETPEDTNTIPSLEVPQADNFETLRNVLEAIDIGSDIKPEITQFLETKTGDEWASRQADYYGIAAWLLGFAHKEKRVQIENRKVRRWGLTRSGEEYLELLRRGEQQEVQARLHEAIRDVEIITRILDILTEERTLERQDLAEILGQETELSGSTTSRRARTVGQWLVELPEVNTSGSGPTQKYEYVE